MVQERAEKQPMNLFLSPLCIKNSRKTKQNRQKRIHRIKSFLIKEKVMLYHPSPNGSAGGCSSAYAAFGGISPLTCTIFDPSIFLRNSASNFFHISPTRLKSSIMGNYLDLAPKIAHRGNTGSHRGKRKLFSMLGV